MREAIARANERHSMQFTLSRSVFVSVFKRYTHIASIVLNI